MTVKAALNKREGTHQIYMKNREFMKARELGGLPGPAHHHLRRPEQRVGMEGPPALEVGFSFSDALLPLREASGTINEPPAEAGQRSKCRASCQPS